MIQYFYEGHRKIQFIQVDMSHSKSHTFAFSQNEGFIEWMGDKTSRGEKKNRESERDCSRVSIFIFWLSAFR